MPRELLPLDVAIDHVMAHASPGRVEEVAIGRALGRVLAEQIQSEFDVPAFDNSAMDGYAIRSADLASAAKANPVPLALVDESRAGHPADASVAKGQAIAISTGAMVPEGADAIVRVEDTSQDNGFVSVHVAAEPGRNVRRAGDDIRRGDELVEPGVLLGPAELGVLASVGRERARAYSRPRVAILATGDELISPGDQMRPGAVRNSNAYALSALVRGSPGRETVNRTVPDTPEATDAAIAEALDQSDAIVISGGVSVGEHDHVKPALDRLGVSEDFWGIALRPGRPTWFGRGRGDVLVFGLPGNPVSSMVTFLLLVRPALERMSGLPYSLPRSRAALTARARGEPDRTHAVRCRLRLGSAQLEATPTRDDQSSHVLTSMLNADCLALLPPGERIWEAGEMVEIVRLPGSLGSNP